MSYNGQFSTSSIANAVDVMTASEFRALGRPDVSAGAVSTDWIEEVTRAANTSFTTFLFQEDKAIRSIVSLQPS